ncbi:hypothetical protein WJX81_008213 [Elliptochloris bilobata]|uniref:Glucosidase 2 subunit beta n=1 Tax=Elliptochloris bilobata TaxID=381761 RepID=A0AAW1QML4_9CHLO
MDGLLTIPRDHLNDNYCDCYDGSDEPGTSACSNGSFYCRNRGHLPLRLNASMVDDLLCDCCDGTDERDGLCRNTCLEAGAAARAELQQWAATAAQGEQLREAYAKAWAQREVQWTSELKQLEADVAQKSKLVSYWQGKKTAVETEERLEREGAEAARAAHEAVAAAAAAASNLTEGGSWTHDPEAVGEIAEEQEAEAAAQEAESEQPDAAVGEVEEVQPAKPGVWGSFRAALAKAMGFLKAAGTQAQQRQHIKDTFVEHQRALTELTSTMAALSRKLGLDFGPSGVFSELLDRCFTVQVEKYTYEVCMYGEARQKEGAASTSLGSWRGFEDGHSALLFDGGQQCWNGPQRSMRVSLQCGVEEKLANVSEPNRRH